MPPLRPMDARECKGCMSDDVIEFAPFLKRKRFGLCSHPSFEVSDTEADLTCTACEKQIDPWWVLRRLAQDDERVAVQLSVARQEVKRLAGEIEALKKERASLMAKVRRLKVKVVDAPKEAGR